MEKVLITGGTGFLGINLANYLLENGYYVFCVDYEDFFGRENYINVIYRDNVSFIYANLLNKDLSDHMPKDIDYVIHLAALPHVDYSRFFPQKTLYNNMMALMNILNYVVANDSEFIFTSSVEIYGGSNNQTYSEKDDLQPLSVYGYTKQAGEEMVRYYINKYKVRSTIVRLTNLYGPLQLPDRVIPRNICRLIGNHSVDLTQNFYRDFLYVEDACGMINSLLTHDKKGEVYNLSTGKAYSMQEAIKEILSCFKNKDIEENNRDFLKETRGRYLLIENKKINTIYPHQCDFKESLRSTIEWYIAHPEWVNQFEKYYSKQRVDETFVIDHDNLGVRINL